jgi:hypothetical protein
MVEFGIKRWRSQAAICGFGVDCWRMAVAVEMHNTGDPKLRRDVTAMIAHVLADRPGDWRVSIMGSQANDRWEMKIHGPHAFERSYTLEGTAVQHEPHTVADIVGKMVPVVR